MADRTWTGRMLFRGEEKGISKSAGKVDKALGGVSRQLKQFGALAVAAGASALFVGTVSKVREFEKSISDLSAITGATGKDLDRLSEASKRIGQTTTLSATQAADAFKLIASAKPDLLQNVAALEATTAAAVTLSEAAGIDLPTAASALGESLNQFGADASEAGRFINVFAASAKFGSSEIAQTSQAFQKFGVVAASANLTVETSAAAVQTLAAAGIKGSEAGTALKTALLKLSTQANDDFNPSVVGMSKALENLDEANLSTTKLMGLFGQEAITAGQILIDQRTEMGLLEGQITGTGEAYAQASKRTDNLDGDIKRLTSAFEAFQLNLGGKGLPIIRETIQLFTNLINTITMMTKSDGGIDAADKGFNTFTETLKALFVVGSVVKNFFDTLFDTLVFVGRSIVDALAGNFDLIDDHFAELSAKTVANAGDIAQFTFRTYNEEAAAELDAGTASLVNAVVTQQTVVEEARTQVALTAGQERSAALEQADEVRRLKEAEAFETKLQGFLQNNLTELEMLQQNNELKLAEIALLEENKFFLEEEANFKRLAAIEAFEEAKRKITMKNATALQKFEMLNAKNKTKFIVGETLRITQGVAQNSKTMFKINKIAAIADATISTAQGVAKAWSLGPIIGPPLAVLTAAAGLAQISAIRSTQFSGGGGGTTPSAAGSVPTLNGQPTGGSGGAPLDGLLDSQAASQRIDINIDGLNEGGIMSADATRMLITSINEQLGDGVNLEVNNEGGGG